MSLVLKPVSHTPASAANASAATPAGEAIAGGDLFAQLLSLQFGMADAAGAAMTADGMPSPRREDDDALPAAAAATRQELDPALQWAAQLTWQPPVPASPVKADGEAMAIDGVAADTGPALPSAAAMPAAAPGLPAGLPSAAGDKPAPPAVFAEAVASRVSAQPLLSTSARAENVPPPAVAAAPAVLAALGDVLPSTAMPARSGARREVLSDEVRLLFRAAELAPAAEPLLPQAANAPEALLAANWLRQNLPATAESAGKLAVTADLGTIAEPMAANARWGAAFGGKVAEMVELRLDSARIQVNPEQLGPLEIAISFDSQDQAQIAVIAANPQAREIVENSLPQLARMLEQSGLQLGGAQVSTSQQQAQQQARQPFAAPLAAPAPADASETAAVAAVDAAGANRAGSTLSVRA